MKICIKTEMIAKWLNLILWQSNQGIAHDYGLAPPSYDAVVVARIVFLPALLFS